MRIVGEGIVFGGKVGSRTASCCFPALLALADGHLLAAWRVGSSKDSADGSIWLSRSKDLGETWSAPEEPFTTTFEGVPGDLHVVKFTDLGGGRLLAALMWFDRSNPLLPMFNPATEGLLPAKTLFAISENNGLSWSPPWTMDDEPYHTPMTITGAVLVMPDGRWACQFEVNKNYDDPGPWRQAAALKFSNDRGQTWGDCTEVACDSTLTVRYWDQRHAVSPDGTCVAMFWTYDHVNQKDLTITSSRSYDAGRTWEPPGDTRIIGAQAYPAFLPDGRMVIAYVDRWNTRAIRVAISSDLGRTFEMFDRPLYKQPPGRVDPGQGAATSEQALQDQQIWTFGCQSLESTQAGNIWATYYAGDSASTNIHWAQLRF